MPTRPMTTGRVRRCPSRRCATSSAARVGISNHWSPPRGAVKSTATKSRWRSGTCARSAPDSVWLGGRIPLWLTCSSAAPPGESMRRYQNVRARGTLHRELSGGLRSPAANLNRVNLDGNQASIREVCDAGVLAGAVTVVWQRGEAVQVNEIGYRDVDAGLPMQRDSLFRIASMTKPVTVAAVMSLVDEGKLTLKDPITRWTPELADVQVLDDPHGPLDRTHPARRAILIEDLLTHSSGLAYGFSASGPIARAYLRMPFNQGSDTWLAELAALP